MMKDATTVESDLSRVSGALRALSGLLHSTHGNAELFSPDDLGYLVACLAADAERAQAGATSLFYAEDDIDGAIRQLRTVKAV